jgi:class 3 adenylate cyclase/pimeloyl-ACP methyl ester carboxylesterase
VFSSIVRLVIVPPPIRYVRNSELSIAYQVVGDAAADLVIVPGILDHMETVWEEPPLVRFIEALTRFSRVILLDRRGCGLSDRLPLDAVPTLDAQADDVRAVMDAAGSERAVILGGADGAQVAIVFAAAHPGRTRALALFSATPAALRREGCPWGIPEEHVDPLAEEVERRWGTGAMAWLLGDDSDQARDAFGRMERRACTPRAAVALMRAAVEGDVRDLLPRISVPTVVVHHPDHPLAAVEGARYLAAQIPGARYLEHDVPFSALEEVISRRGMVQVVEELITGAASPEHDGAVLAAVLFTDIVGSTEHAARLGDQRWRDVLSTHEGRARAAAERAGGRIVKTTGDGLVLCFDGAARAVRCAQAVVTEGKRLGLGVRAGVHAGDCERRGGDVFGLTVHVAARVAALAAAGEVLVTGTVRDMVLGSALAFADRGRQTLRGVPEEWALYAVR